MAKIKLITNNKTSYSFCHHPHLRPVVEQYFEIVDYANWNQSINNCIIVINSSNENGDWYKSLISNGAKLLVDNLWEYHQHDKILNRYSNSFVCSSKNFFWINECYYYKSLKFNTYIPSKQCTHTALMPMGLIKPHRDMLLEKVMPWISEIIYSYTEKNIFLPNDLLTENINTFASQRYFNPSWYNNTYFSIVAESFIGSSENLMITEKTFKPIAFEHPFMLLGQTGSLEYLHKLGFETYENLFNESYDTIKPYSARIDIIVDSFKNFVKQEYNQLTQEKIKHNRALFYNSEIVEKMLLNEIINPIFEYAET